MIIRFLLESGVTQAEIFGEIETKDIHVALEMVGEKAKALFLALHPELTPKVIPMKEKKK